MEDIIKELEARRLNAKLGGGQKRIDAQHKKGKLTARERISLLLDEDSFEEYDMFVNKIQDMALKNNAPLIGVLDAGGARIQEGIDSLGGYAEVFQRNVLASGVIPQISIIMGPCAGGDVYSPALTDFIFMVKDTSYMFVTGPDVVKTVTNEEVTSEQLGGSEIHTTVSSVADGAYENDLEMMEQIRELIDFLPSSNINQAPIKNTNDPIDRVEDSLDTLVPDNSNTPYDIKELILKVIDESDFFEIQEKFAQNIVTGFGRFDGFTAGIIGNQPMHLAGVLDSDSKKIAEYTEAYEDRFLNPFVAAERGYVDDVIMPHNSRNRIIKALKMLRNKKLSNPWKKHDNLPL